MRANYMVRTLWVCLLAFLISPAKAQDDGLPQVIDIPYKKYTLKNGLRLIVHEDRKAPIVAVNVWYHVGSKNEKPGRTGFAHLFEHLMFNGSENFNDDYFKAMDQIGATDLNGTTNEDRTNYFETAPRNALDIVLWMESDRMGHFVGAISKERLDEQRGVVQNEKRQGENQPYGRAQELIVKATYPAGHPYSWTVIGSMEDLNAASLDDVKTWFKDYYGAANAIVVVAGDVSGEEALAKVEKYFGDIPSGPPVDRFSAWIAKRTGSSRQVMQDRVPQARIYKVWNVPPWKSEEADLLNLLSDVLTSGKTSRLYNRLVYNDQIATQVSAFLDSREIGSQFYIMATARPGTDLAKVEKAIDEELARLLKDGITKEELTRVKIEQLAGFIRGAERIGGFGGKSDILAQNEVYGGDPGFYKTSLKRIREATPKQVQEAAKAWLTDGVYNLEVHPFPELTTVKSEVDRSKLPELGEVADARFPDLQRAELDNGLKIVLAERNTIPQVLFNLVVDAGYAADASSIPGTAKLAMNMLDEGTKSRNALQISDQSRSLGANIGTGSDLDTSVVSLNSLKSNLDKSLELYADIILNPAFPDEDFNRLKKQQSDAIQREKVQPFQMALRVLPGVLYGPGHAYSQPMTGSGTEESVSRITVSEARKFYDTWFKPNNATLIVVGDIKLDEVKKKVQTHLGKWARGSVPQKNISKVEQATKKTVYLLDRPGSIQSTVLAGNLTLPKDNPDEIGVQMFNNVLGGQFTSRLNMNLREDKHWSYGAGSAIFAARGQRPFLAYAQVQTDKTKESLAEVVKEFSEILKDRPTTADELKKFRTQQVLELVGSWETMGSVGGSIHEIVKYGLPDDYFQTYPGKLKQLTLEQVGSAGPKVLDLNQVIYVVVGDLSKIESGVRELNLGDVKYINADGKLIEKSAGSGGN